MNSPTAFDRGRLVVVGGHSRHVGKTTVVEALLRELPAGKWSAVKISSHRHGARGAPFVFTEDTDHATDTQTGRYLRAGARRAFLLRAPDASFSAALSPLGELLAAGMNLIVESNRIVQHVDPDLTLFVISPAIPDWKASSGPCLRKAHGVVIAGGNPEVLWRNGSPVPAAALDGVLGDIRNRMTVSLKPRSAPEFARAWAILATCPYPFAFPCATRPWPGSSPA